MKKRIFYLDFIRALSFIFIVIFHFNVSIGAHNIYVNSTNIPIIFYDYKNGNLGQIGVSLFFIISGAGLMLSNKENFNLKHFFNKRIFSLFPMFYLAYFLVTCYYFIRYASLNPFGVMRGKASFVWTILGMDGYLAPLIPNYYLLGEWFLGCIILLYCLFPVLRYLLIKMNKYVSILLVGLIYIITVQFYPFENYPIEFFVIARMLEFFFGMFVIMYIPKIKGLYLGGGIFIVCIWALVDIPLQQIYKTTIMGIALFLILAYIGQHIPDYMKSPFCTISKYSYPAYLLHHVVIEQICSRFDNISLSLFATYFLFFIVGVAIVLITLLLNKIYLYLNMKLEYCINILRQHNDKC